MTSPNSVLTFQASDAVSPNVTVGNVGGSTAVTGAFEGSDGGSTSVIHLNSAMSNNEFQVMCASKFGVPGFNFVSGSLSLG
jgi:hypothetical protein